MLLVARLCSICAKISAVVLIFEVISPMPTVFQTIKHVVKYNVGYFCSLVLSLPASLSKEERARWHRLAEKSRLQSVSKVKASNAVPMQPSITVHFEAFYSVGLIQP